MREAMRPFLLFACGALAVAGCGGSSEFADFSEFDAAIEDYLADSEVDGATAVVVDREAGIVHLRGYGAFDPDRVSLIASSSKVLSVGVLMRLADEGLLDIDAPISDYLQPWGDHKMDITTAQLLSNSAGMVGLLDDPTYAPYLCQYLDGGTLSECAEEIYTADDEEDRVPPDTEFRYGGGQWQLAGGIAEMVSGQSWDELIEETYVEPCGMTSTAYNNHFSQSFLGGGGVDGALSYPDFFDGDPSVLEPTDNPNIEGGAYTTAEDYGRALLLHLREGVCDGTRVLSEAAVQRMQEDRIGEVYGGTTIDPTLPGYGLGWWVDRNNPGVVADAGAYGAVPWLDVERGYGAMIILEDEATQGVNLRLQTQPILEAIFDALEE
ncbi:MAG: serine hydrolase domain-containing protein [Myxococcota bacterium]